MLVVFCTGSEGITKVNALLTMNICMKIRDVIHRVKTNLHQGIDI